MHQHESERNVFHLRTFDQPEHPACATFVGGNLLVSICRTLALLCMYHTVTRRGTVKQCRIGRM